jgi:hypothetical protein
VETVAVWRRVCQVRSHQSPWSGGRRIPPLIEHEFEIQHADVVAHLGIKGDETAPERRIVFLIDDALEQRNDHGGERGFLW